MTEAFLHYTWKFRLFNTRPFLTTKGETIEVISPGIHNKDSGPDFFNARLRIGDTLWAGNVETHLNASDWLKHNHQHDPAYDNTILHAVFNYDRDIYTTDGQEIPVVELREYIPIALIEKFESLLQSEHWIPCEEDLKAIPAFDVENWLDRLLTERLERKCKLIEDVFNYNKGDWEETTFQLIARNFGFNTNALPFEMLARSVSSTLIARLNNPLQIEAVLFGQAGLLDIESSEPYILNLKTEYAHLRVKHQLTPMSESVWKFSRLRPLNFPTIRIAQFAQVLASNKTLFGKLLGCETIGELRMLFKHDLNKFWDTHYNLSHESDIKKKFLGKSSVDNILVNTLLPLLFFYGEKRQSHEYKELALRLFEELQPEENLIIKGWRRLNIKARNAGQAQSLIQLKNEFCDRRRCLECGLGNKILTIKREVEIV